MQNIGEALRQLEARFPEVATKISDHERIIQFRHVLVHGYDTLKRHFVWNVIENNLQTLCTDVENILNE